MQFSSHTKASKQDDSQCSLCFGTVVQSKQCSHCAPLTDWTRLLLHDPSLFFEIPGQYNFTSILFALNSIYMNYHMYHPHSKRLIQLLKQVQSNDCVGFFVEQTIAFKGAKQLVTRVIRYKTRLFYNHCPTILLLGNCPQSCVYYCFFMLLH